MDDDQKRAFDFVVSLRDFYGDYQHKKEREAYVTTAAYLAATGAAFWKWSDGQHGILPVAVLAVTILVAVLVWWQLGNRRFGARMVAASTTVASRWLAASPPRPEYNATRLGEVFYPDAVVRAFNDACACPTLVLQIVVPIAILVWGGVISCRLAN